MKKKDFIEKLIDKKVKLDNHCLCIYEPGNNYTIIEAVYEDIFLASHFFYTGEKLATNLLSITSIELIDYKLFE